MIYLDTHAAVWLYAGNKRLFSRTALKRIESGSLFISPIVVLEIRYMNEIGRVNPKAEDIVSHLKEVCDLSICRKKFEDVCFKAITIDFTRDPFDRIITAHAALDNNPLMTKDQSILRHYQGAIW